MSSPVKLYTSHKCGWAMRNYAALLEKEMSFDLVPANDQYGNKTSSFLALGPSRKTPVLEHDGTVVWESRIINEYIEEAFPGARLLPSDPGLRAKARNLSFYCDDVLMPLISQVVRTETLGNEMDILNAAIGSLDRFAFHPGHSGPYWRGTEFSLVDICFLNFFDNLSFISKKFASVKIDLSQKLGDWGEAIASRASVLRAEEIAQQFDKNEVRKTITP
jgi:glutathione S-transferase